MYELQSIHCFCINSWRYGVISAVIEDFTSIFPDFSAVESIENCAQILWHVPFPMSVCGQFNFSVIFEHEHVTDDTNEQRMKIWTLCSRRWENFELLTNWHLPYVTTLLYTDLLKPQTPSAAGWRSFMPSKSSCDPGRKLLMTATAATLHLQQKKKNPEGIRVALRI